MGAHALQTGIQGARTCPLSLSSSHLETDPSGAGAAGAWQGQQLLLTSQVSQLLAQKQNGGLKTSNFLNR